MNFQAGEWGRGHSVQAKHKDAARETFDSPGDAPLFSAQDAGGRGWSVAGRGDRGARVRIFFKDTRERFLSITCLP